MASRQHKPMHRHDRRRGKRTEPGRQHTALWRSKTCVCGAALRVAEEDTGGGRLRGAVINRDPDLDGLLVRRADGYLERDPRHVLDGPRYAWHNCPARNP